MSEIEITDPPGVGNALEEHSRLVSAIGGASRGLATPLAMNGRYVAVIVPPEVARRGIEALQNEVALNVLQSLITGMQSMIRAAEEKMQSGIRAASKADDR